MNKGKLAGVERDDYEQWAQRAGASASRVLWGKAMPEAGSVHPAHPLVCHMLDVAAVAGVLLDDILPEPLVTCLAAPFSTDREMAKRWLQFVVALHDLGKASPGFQGQVPLLKEVLKHRGFPLDAPDNARNHGTFGAGLVRKIFRERFAVVDAVAVRLARAVAAHHGTFPADVDAFPRPPVGPKEDGGEPWAAARAEIVDTLFLVIGPTGTLGTLDARTFSNAYFVLLAGLTSVADWIGSMAEVFTYAAPDVDFAAYAALSRERARTAVARIGMRSAAVPAPRSFHALFALEPWPLHLAAEHVARALDDVKLVVIEAPMGEGKTEAALLLAEHIAARRGLRGLFVGLPTQATANQLFGRVEKYLRRVHAHEVSTLQLAHGDAVLESRFQSLLAGIYSSDGPGEGAVRAEGWFTTGKRALLAANAVGTVDQALLGVLRTRHGFVRVFGLAGKVVVLDEVHAYDTYTSTLLDRLIEWLVAAGSVVVLLSATLPSARRAALLKAAGATRVDGAGTPYPRISVVRGDRAEEHAVGSRARRLDVVVERLDDETALTADALLARIADGGCAGWICNTVSRAQTAFRELRARQAAGTLDGDVEVVLIHARFPADARSEREQWVESCLGRAGTRPHRAVLIGTQVLEQSLDVDFDVLATDIAPIDLILQRLGRLHRHDRASRPAAVAIPTVFLVGAKGRAMDVDIDRVAGIYDPFLMRRTLLALEGVNTVCLPSQIESFVERVYTAPGPVEHATVLDALRKKAETKWETESLKARQSVLAKPCTRDDIFGESNSALDEDDPSLHVSLRAMTRLGPPSVDVVCLHEGPWGLSLDPHGHEPVDLTAATRSPLLEKVLRRTVGINSRGLAPALIAQGCPPEWTRTSLLRHRRVLAFRDGRVRVGDFVLRLDSELGVVIDR